MIRTSVIVPARDAEATLGRALERILDQEPGFDHEIVVVDDGSVDATADVAAAAPGPVRLVRQARLGPAAARNRGVAEARGELLAFCDADCFPAPGWLRAGVAAMADAELVQGRVLPDPEVEPGPFDRTLWIVEEAGLWETANLFVTRAVFDRVGGFEDWLRPVSGKALAEDVWFGWRAKRVGARSAFCAEALAHHAVFPRGAQEYVAERRRLRHFPRLVARMPELRGSLLYGRLFLNRRSVAVDAALAGLAAAVATRRVRPLLAALPYAWPLWRRALAYGSRAPEVAAVDLAADVTGALALARGSIEARTPVL